MVNKKSFIKTLEAIIALVALIIFVFSIAAIGIKTGQEPPGNVVDAQNFIFKTVINSEEYREDVLNFDNEGDIDELVSKIVPFSYDYETQICDLDYSTCEPDTTNLILPEKTVYVSSLYVIDTANTGINTAAGNEPKILKVFMWEK